VTSALPKVTPLVLKRRAAAFDNPDWLFDLKYDGFRALLKIDAVSARLVSRNRNRFKHLHPPAAALAKRLRVNDAIRASLNRSELLPISHRVFYQGAWAPYLGSDASRARRRALQAKRPFRGKIKA
jgi:hypothetical protein